ncbi:MAG: ComF family protein [Bacteroidota bacterium]
MFKALRSLLVLEACYGCDRELTSQEKYLCLSCHAQLQETAYHHRPRENELYRRLAGRVPIDGAAAFCHFDKGGRMQRLIKAFKYQQATGVAIYLGEYYGRMLAEGDFLAGIKALVPVPLHPTKQRQRGYNQAEKIAQGLSQSTGLPVNTQLLFRKRKTATQARKAGSARWENVAGAFEIQNQVPEGILLVDDVVTTGATLEACARAILDQAQTPPLVKVACLGVARSH